MSPYKLFVAGVFLMIFLFFASSHLSLVRGQSPCGPSAETWGAPRIVNSPPWQNDGRPEAVIVIDGVPNRY